jgi:hypothetical protein
MKTKKITSTVNSDSGNLQNKKMEAVRMAMEQITKAYGEGAIMKMGDRKADMSVEAIPTGCIPLDIALGIGGLPRGRITEIFGPEASGKTTVCLHLIAEAQKIGGTAAFIDVEHALDPERAATVGVNLDNLLISQPDNGEQALEIVETLVRSNAVDVVRSLKERQILFVPDKNLGTYIARLVPEKEFILWDGYCITHNRVRKEEVIKIKDLYQDVKLLVHPECDIEIVDMADFVGSTKQIIDYANNSEDKSFIIGTEMGILYQLKKDNPDKNFYLLSQSLICPNMKKTSLLSIRDSLLKKEHEIELAKDIIENAKLPLERMLRV